MAEGNLVAQCRNFFYLICGDLWKVGSLELRELYGGYLPSLGRISANKAGKHFVRCAAKAKGNLVAQCRNFST
jgi:hypothetical protein